MTTYNEVILYLKTTPIAQIRKEVALLPMGELDTLIDVIGQSKPSKRLTAIRDQCHREQYGIVFGGYDRLN